LSLTADEGVFITNAVAGSAAEAKAVDGAGLSSSISEGGGSDAAITGLLSDLNPSIISCTNSCL